MTDVRAPAAPTGGGGRQSDIRWVSLAVLILVAIRLVAAALIDLGADESYYFLWSRHLSWSYYDHPPMVAWWIAAGVAIFGDGPFGVRVLFALSTIPTSLAVYLTARVLFDQATGALAALWINATLLVGVGGISATPDAPAVMFWALAICAFAFALSGKEGRWWLAFGLFAGLGVMSKLTDLFLGLGVLLCLLVHPDIRRRLASPWPWTGGVIAALVVAPMVLWNAAHDWVTFAHQFARLSPTALNPLKFPELVATQFALLNPLIAIFLGLGVVVWVTRRPAYPVRPIGILVWTTVPLVAYMALHSLHSQVQAHWLAPIFPTLAIIAAAAAQAAPAKRWAGPRWLAFPVGAALSLIGLVLAANPGGVLPPRLDPGQVNHGWDGVAADADRLRTEIGAAWIATANYAAGASIAYNLRHADTPVIPVTDRKRYIFAPAPNSRLSDLPALVIARETERARLGGCFSELDPITVIERKSGGATVETLVAFRAAGASPTLFADGC